MISGRDRATGFFEALWPARRGIRSASSYLASGTVHFILDVNGYFE